MSRRRQAAVPLLAVAASLAVPQAALAQSGYTSEASAQAIVVTTSPTATQPATETVAAEATAATSSEAGIIEDQPGDFDESQALGVATTTEVRAEDSAGTVDTSGAMVGTTDESPAEVEVVEGPVAVDAGSAEASIEATEQSTSALAEGGDVVAAGEVESTELEVTAPQVAASVPAAGAHAAAVSDLADSERDLPVHFAMAGAYVEEGEGGPVTALEGYVTLGAAASTSVAVSIGGFHAFSLALTFVQDLKLHEAPNGDALIHVHAAQGVVGEPGDNYVDIMQMRVTIGGITAMVDTINGVDLLDPVTWSATPLADAFAAIQPRLQALTGPGGALQGLMILLGHGGATYSSDGDWARAWMEAVHVEATPHGENAVAIAIAKTYAAVDAERAFSTITDPSWPVMLPPVSDEERAFPASRAAVAAESLRPRAGGGGGGTDEEEVPGVPVLGDVVDTAVLAAEDLPRTGAGLTAVGLAGVLAIMLGAGLVRGRPRPFA